MRISQRAAGLLLVAYSDPGEWVAWIRYLDGQGNVTERTISPLRYLTEDRVIVYCLGREGVRTLWLSRILTCRLRMTADVLPPEGVRALVLHPKRLRADKSTDTS